MNSGIFFSKLPGSLKEEGIVKTVSKTYSIGTESTASSDDRFWLPGLSEIGATEKASGNVVVGNVSADGSLYEALESGSALDRLYVCNDGSSNGTSTTYRGLLTRSINSNKQGWTVSYSPEKNKYYWFHMNAGYPTTVWFCL